MFKKFNFKVISPKGIQYDSSIADVQLKTTNGYMTVLKNHIPMICNLVPSTIFIRKDDNTIEAGIISNGLLMIEKNETKVITELFVLNKNIDLHKEEERKRILEEKISHEKDLKKLKTMKIDLINSINMINTKKKY